MYKLLYKGPESHNNLTAEALFTAYHFSTPHSFAVDASEGTLKSSYNPQEIYPSRKGRRKYRFHILPRNKLRVLLVSDPASRHSSAAMSVGVGNFDDPPTHEGLAHLCEHTVLMGSTKYPSVDYYKQIVSAFSGNTNAETGAEKTMYYFETANTALLATLDIFAQFFISPIFFDNYLTKEIEVVHQEYQRSKKSEVSTMKRLLGYVSNPSHPMHKFGTGDHTTLQKKDIKYQLKNFFDTKYSANLVSLAILLTFFTSIMPINIMLVFIIHSYIIRVFLNQPFTGITIEKDAQNNVPRLLPPANVYY